MSALFTLMRIIITRIISSIEKCILDSIEFKVFQTLKKYPHKKIFVVNNVVPVKENTLNLSKNLNCVNVSTVQLLINYSFK